LAGFAPEEASGRALDLGAGTGVVGLEALMRGRLRGITEIWFAEAEEALMGPLEANLRRAAGLLPSPPKMLPLRADWRELSVDAFPGGFGFVTCNPPYNEMGRGRSAPGLRGAQREERRGTLGDLVKAAAGLLSPGGVFTLCLPLRRLAGLLASARGHGLAPALINFPPRRSAPLALISLESRRLP
jgi:tRNA1(Val) A37 N6-methylase TrmN6